MALRAVPSYASKNVLVAPPCSQWRHAARGESPKRQVGAGQTPKLCTSALACFLASSEVQSYNSHHSSLKQHFANHRLNLSDVSTVRAIDREVEGVQWRGDTVESVQHELPVHAQGQAHTCTVTTHTAQAADSVESNRWGSSTINHSVRRGGHTGTHDQKQHEHSMCHRVKARQTDVFLGKTIFYSDFFKCSDSRQPLLSLLQHVIQQLRTAWPVQVKTAVCLK
jgi:hypothetical protein